jgi:hypothetical protein
VVAKRNVLKRQMPLITVAASAVLLTVIYFADRSFVHSKSDSIVEQTAEPVRDPKPAPSPNSVPSVAANEFSLSTPVLFEGAVDGSAAADVDDGFFVDATDEITNFVCTMSLGALHSKS